MGLRAALLLAVLTAPLAGCCALGPPADVVTDAELRGDGAWTEDDALARRLIGPAAGRRGYRAVRLPPLERKLAGVKSAVETVTGLRYEKRSYYSPEARAYVLLRRDGPPIIVGEEFDQPVEVEDTTPPEVWVDVDRRLEADMELLMGEEEPLPEDVRPK